MKEWQQRKFGELYKVPSRNGLSKPSRVRGSGYKMINMGELFANDRIYDIDMELVPLTDSEKEKAKVESGDLLFARQSLIASGAGKCSIVMKTSELTVFESHLIRVRLDQEIADPMFYYYYFKSPRSPMRTIIEHCVQAGIKASDLEKLLVKVPPIEEQRKTARVLSRIDKKIEVNKEINENLLQQALAYSNFLRNYEAALAVMYEYQIIIDKMQKENEKHPMTTEEAEKMFSEEKYRENLYNALDNLKKAYDAVAEEKVKKQIKKQLKLV